MIEPGEDASEARLLALVWGRMIGIKRATVEGGEPSSDQAGELVGLTEIT